MREILFRGKTPKGEWVEGFYYINRYRNAGSEYFIAENPKITTGITEASGAWGERVEEIEYEIIPETIGQYTGLTDKNGKKIFEGDILEFSDRLVVVFWHAHLGCWDCKFLKFTNKENGKDDMSPVHWEYKSIVIGNIHDNPEFLKGGE